MNRYFPLLAAGLLAATSVSAAKTPRRLKVAYVPIADALQLYVAQEKGYFKDEGLDVQLKPMEGGAVMVPAVASGAVDIGFANTVTMSLARVQGFDLVCVAPGAFRTWRARGVLQLAVPKNSPVRRAKDLEGRAIAVNNLGNVAEVAVRAWARENKVDQAKLRFVEAPFPQMEPLLANARLEAATLIEPFATLGREHGSVRILNDDLFGAVASRFMVAGWFAEESWAAKNAAPVAAFARAIDRASEYLARQPSDIPDILSKHTKLSADLAAKIAMPAFERKLKRADLDAVIEATRQAGLLKKPLDAAALAAPALKADWK